MDGVGADPLSALDEHVHVEEMHFPDTTTLADDAVVIKVHSAAVHWVDLLMLAGQYQHAASIFAGNGVLGRNCLGRPKCITSNW